MTKSSEQLKVLDLFSGIGGFSLGLERAGMRTVAFCEIEEFPRRILRKHWPDVPIFEDIRKLHAEDLPEAIDVICGGYPCQPFSIAGKRRGKDDDRYLWPEVVRLIRELDQAGRKPGWCLFENVTGYVSLGLDQALSDLEGEDYACWPVIIPACAVNAPHRRDRVWIIAHCDHVGRKECDLPSKPGDKRQSVRRSNAKISPADSESEQDRGIFRPWFQTDPESGCDWRGKTEEWTTESPICDSDNGIPDRVARLKALGNAVVPQIPELIGWAICECEKRRNDLARKTSVEQLIRNQQVAGSSPIATPHGRMERFPSGQRGQTVNLLARPSEVRILPSSTT